MELIWYGGGKYFLQVGKDEQSNRSANNDIKSSALDFIGAV